MKLKVHNKGFGSYYSGFIQVIFGSLPCILGTYVVKLLLCKIYTSWLWISCIVLTPMFNFNFSPLRTVVFGIFLILIWALYPAVLSKWTPNHLAELNFSSGKGCEVSQPKIKYSQLLCSVEVSQSDHQHIAKQEGKLWCSSYFFSIWKLLCSSWDICWKTWPGISVAELGISGTSVAAELGISAGSHGLCEQAMVQGQGSAEPAQEGSWPCQLGFLSLCPPWAGSAPALLCLPAGLTGGGEGQWQYLVTALELGRLASALNSLPGGLEGSYLEDLFTLLDDVGRAGNERKYILVLALIRLISIILLVLTLLKHNAIFHGSCAKTGVLSSCDIHVVILGSRVLCSTLKSKFVFLRGSAISNKPLMFFCLRRVYKIKMHCAVNHMDVEFQYSELFLSERLLHKLFIFKKSL